MTRLRRNLRLTDRGTLKATCPICSAPLILALQPGPGVNYATVSACSHYLGLSQKSKPVPADNASRLEQSYPGTMSVSFQDYHRIKEYQNFGIYQKG